MSPKRKREDLSAIMASLPPLQISTVNNEDATSEASADSPRTRVAEKLQQLGIESTEPPEVDQTELRMIPRKHLKRSASELSSIEDVSETTMQLDATPEHTSQTLEIVETPDCRIHPSPVPPRSPRLAVYRRVAFSPPAKDEIEVQVPNPSHIPSPPPPAPLTSPTHMSDTGLKRPMSPLDLDYELGPSPKALVWQDSEITGHDIDSSTPDDDGEGINGIGFRPTPAMAYMRSKRRKQQVSEWKAREARDARQRRIERRRGASGETSREAAARRMVRFAEVG